MKLYYLNEAFLLISFKVFYLLIYLSITILTRTFRVLFYNILS